MVIEIICKYPAEIVMGGAGLIGALAMAGVSVYNKKKEDKKFKFDVKKVIDTVWQSAAAGYVAGLTLTCGYYGIFVAMITGFGVDKIANKLSINKTQVLNFTQLISGWLSSKDNKKK